MHLSFQFNDFFRDRAANIVNRSDVTTPTFLVQSGVVGDLKIKDVQENLLSARDARIEVKLEGMFRIFTHIAQLTRGRFHEDRVGYQS